MPHQHRQPVEGSTIPGAQSPFRKPSSVFCRHPPGHLLHASQSALATHAALPICKSGPDRIPGNAGIQMLRYRATTSTAARDLNRRSQLYCSGSNMAPIVSIVLAS